MAAKIHADTTLEIQEVNGTYRMASPDEIIHAAKSAINRRFRRGKALSSPADSQDFLKLRLAQHNFKCDLQHLFRPDPVVMHTL